MASEPSGGYTTNVYDANGDTIKTAVGAVTNLFSYNEGLDQLISATNNGAMVYEIGYDGDGNRVFKEILNSANQDVVTFYLVDDVNPSGYAQVLEEYQGVWDNNSGKWDAYVTLARAYNYGSSLISQQQFDPNTLLPSVLSYYGYDGHGSVRFLMDTSGTITDTYTYDAYGTLLTPARTTPNNYLYCGQQWDPDLGLYYNRARYMAPGIGRFMSMDGDYGNNEDPLSLHKYLYAEDDSVNNADPDGHGIADLTLSMNFNTMLAGLTLTGIAAADVYSHGELAQVAVNETLALGGSAVSATESALSVYRTSVRQLIQVARSILKQNRKAYRKVKVIPMPRSVIPMVAAHVAAAQASGYPKVLRRVSYATRVANYYAAVASMGSAGSGNSWDEYPFASGRPLMSPASVVAVPKLQNFIQGGIIGGCYIVENINVGDRYVVVVTP